MLCMLKKKKLKTSVWFKLIETAVKYEAKLIRVNANSTFTHLNYYLLNVSTRITLTDVALAQNTFELWS